MLCFTRLNFSSLFFLLSIYSSLYTHSHERAKKLRISPLKEKVSLPRLELHKHSFICFCICIYRQYISEVFTIAICYQATPFKKNRTDEYNQYESGEHVPFSSFQFLWAQPPFSLQPQDILSAFHLFWQ